MRVEQALLNQFVECFSHPDSGDLDFVRFNQESDKHFVCESASCTGATGNEQSAIGGAERQTATRVLSLQIARNDHYFPVSVCVLCDGFA